MKAIIYKAMYVLYRHTGQSERYAVMDGATHGMPADCKKKPGKPGFQRIFFSS